MQRAGKMPALPEHCAETSSLSIWMRCLQRVVANRAARRDSEMNRGSPAFQAMMAGAMEQVGDADRGSRRRHLDPSKQRMVIHNGVRQEDFIDAAPPEIERRSVIQGAPRANAREQPIVLAIPKTVNAGRMRIGGLGSVGTLLLVRGSGATCRLRCGRRVGIPGIGRLLLRLNRGYSREQKKCSRHREPHPFPHRKMFSPLVSRMGSTDCGQAWKGCKAGKKISPEIFFSDRPKRPWARWRVGNPTTRNCIFSLDTTRAAAQNPRNFFRAYLVHGTGTVHRERKKWRVIPQGEKACSICRDGRCNALIRSARHAATGCGPPTPEVNFAAIVALRSTMSRLR